jgi:glycosyltransferase involved in cell wall biosynthesis
LARLFDQVVHVAPLHSEPAPPSALAYTAANVELCPVPPSGGEGWQEKLGILAQASTYVRTIQSEMRRADVVHVRCPANISLLAVLWLAAVGQPQRRWIKYAGNWRPTTAEAWSYTLQRWWLVHAPHKAQVTVNGEWPDQPPHVHAFYNPCLTDEELHEARKIAATKCLASPLRLLFVGRLEEAKGIERALHVAAALVRQGIPLLFDLVGDGPERTHFTALATALDIADCVAFHGWVPRTRLVPYYAAAHIFLFPSYSEGWPKVLSEAMAYGVVPVASHVSSIPGYLVRFNCGRTCAPDDVAGFVEAIADYTCQPQRWTKESQRATQAARYFTYTSYLAAVSSLLELPQLTMEQPYEV